MKEIQDAQLLEHYLSKYQIRSLFENTNLPFRLWEYEPGEMMNILRPTTEYMKFVVEGSFDLYTIRLDGTRHLIYHCAGYGFLGDLEFCGKPSGARYQEVTERIRTIELPVEPLRPILQEDNRFVRFLLENLANKLSSTLPSGSEFTNLTDALIYHLRYECPDCTITKIEETAFRLNYSRRQLQRVLQTLTNRGVVEHVKKGCYRLVTE